MKMLKRVVSDIVYKEGVGYGGQNGIFIYR